MGKIKVMNVPICLTRKVFNQYVLLTMVYGSETSALRNCKQHRNIWREYSYNKDGEKENINIRDRTEVTDVITGGMETKRCLELSKKV